MGATVNSSTPSELPASPPRGGSPQGSLGSRQIGFLPLIAVMYLTISGGAYGIEDAVAAGGPRMTLLLCLLVPAAVSLPTALMAAELTALFPVEGGFYFWVKEAFGSFAGFAEAYLTILYTCVDMAIYPVLFASYLSFLLPASPIAGVLLAVAMVWICGILNLLGVRPVGHASVLLTVVLLAPFVGFIGAGLASIHHWRLPPASLTGGSAPFGALGAALAVVIWNFCGWENLSVVAAEIRGAQKNYARAVAVVLPLVVIGYFLPLAVGIAVVGNPARWTTGAFARIGQRVGGVYLGAALAIGGMISALAVFQAAMLWVSRMPFVLARERFLPQALTRMWERQATPWTAIVASCVVCTLLLPLGFAALVTLDVTFYMAALALEMAALVRLRRLYPGRRGGLFMIGAGRLGLMLTVAAPLLVWVATFGIAANGPGGRIQLVVAAILAVAVWPVYHLCQRIFGGPK
ncbi:MAG TPA: APC family permease [Candidatus Binataceae bacterium]|jgi:amino acid transporter|nr:APC family permease [Candidatus Binataceae bacterium]